MQAFSLTTSSMWVKKEMWQLKKKKVSLPLSFLIELGEYLSNSPRTGQTAPGGIVFFSGNYNVRGTMINWSMSRREGTGWRESFKLHHVRSIQWTGRGYLSWKRKGGVTFSNVSRAGTEKRELFYLPDKTKNMRGKNLLAQCKAKLSKCYSCLKLAFIHLINISSASTMRSRPWRCSSEQQWKEAMELSFSEDGTFLIIGDV